MKDNFSTYHPIINLLYFLMTIGISMFFLHPIILCISIFAALAYGSTLQGIQRTAKQFFVGILPIMIIVALLNPMFSHYGVTILFYLENGNPVTLESMIYGIVMSCMLCSVILWFQCYNGVMTSDKFIYLFGRILPTLSLILSMCLRFVPKFQHRLQVIRDGQKCIGRDVSSGNLFQKITRGIQMLSILVTWSLEDGLQTADSMRARGYGVKRRTSFAIYRFDSRDGRMMAAMIGLFLIFVIGCAGGYAHAEYNPQIIITGVPFSMESMVVYGSYCMICMLPLFVNGLEYYRWRCRRGNY